MTKCCDKISFQVYLNEDVGTRDDLNRIVPDEERLDVHCLTIFHVAWTPDLDLVYKNTSTFYLHLHEVFFKNSG